MQGTKNLTEGVISRQLFNLAMPIMGTSFIQMAYSITDMAWVGRLGSEAEWLGWGGRLGRRGRSRYRRRWYPYLDDELDLLLE